MYKNIKNNSGLYMNRVGSLVLTKKHEKIYIGSKKIISKKITIIVIIIKIIIITKILIIKIIIIRIMILLVIIIKVITLKKIINLIKKKFKKIYPLK